jgi:hypothetical protein
LDPGSDIYGAQWACIVPTNKACPACPSRRREHVLEPDFHVNVRLMIPAKRDTKVVPGEPW